MFMELALGAALQLAQIARPSPDVASAPPAAEASAADGPQLRDGWLMLKMGQSAAVRFAGDVVTLLPPGSVVLDEKTGKVTGEGVNFDFKPFMPDGSPPGSLMTITNGYDRTIQYDAEIYGSSGRHVHTSTCPVIPHGSTYEMWPNKIAFIAVAQLRYGRDTVCK